MEMGKGARDSAFRGKPGFLGWTPVPAPIGPQLSTPPGFNYFGYQPKPPSEPSGFSYWHNEVADIERRYLETSASLETQLNEMARILPPKAMKILLQAGPSFAADVKTLQLGSLLATMNQSFDWASNPNWNTAWEDEDTYPQSSQEAQPAPAPTAMAPEIPVPVVPLQWGYLLIHNNSVVGWIHDIGAGPVDYLGYRESCYACEEEDGDLSDLSGYGDSGCNGDGENGYLDDVSEYEYGSLPTLPGTMGPYTAEDLEVQRVLGTIDQRPSEVEAFMDHLCKLCATATQLTTGRRAESPFFPIRE